MIVNNLFHGTGEQLEIITPGYNEPGAWFTTDKKNAMNYAKGDFPNIYSVSIEVENTMTVDFFRDFNEEENCISIEGLEFFNNVSIVEYAISKGFDSVNFPFGNFTESNNTWVVLNADQITILK